MFKNAQQEINATYKVFIVPNAINIFVDLRTQNLLPASINCDDISSTAGNLYFEQLFQP